MSRPEGKLVLGASTDGGGDVMLRLKRVYAQHIFVMQWIQVSTFTKNDVMVDTIHFERNKDMPDVLNPTRVTWKIISKASVT